jgi:hypothetical protein
MKHGDVQTMKGSSISSIFGMVKVSFISGKYPNPANEEKYHEIAEYIYKIVNREGAYLKSPDNFLVSKEIADSKGVVSTDIFIKILFTVGITENLKYWSENLYSMNFSHYCSHGDS